MRQVRIGDITIDAVIEREGPWRRPQDFFPAYDEATFKRHLPDMEPEVFDAGLGMIFGAATLYGFGKTFFWPTMLGVTAEQCPKGGALTLNAISGIGMIAVGVLGTPFIGYIQSETASSVLTEKSEAVAAAVVVPKEFMGIEYQAIDPDKEKTITDQAGLDALADAKKSGQFDALGKMVMFPAFMLACYVGLFLYFKSKGGYKAQSLGGSH